VKDSFVLPGERYEWIVDPARVAKTKHYVRQLLTRKNPYTKRSIVDDPTVIVLGLMNEPHYLDRAENAEHPNCRALYESWLRKNKRTDDAKAYAAYRNAVVRQYIDGMHDAIRRCGARQPVVWCCNWPRMIRRREDVFQAVADSRAEAIAFCLYPGQDDAGPDPWKHPRDLSGNNYLPYIEKVYKREDWLGWIRQERFRGKAKVVGARTT
jgi:hypothetical protein